MFSHFKPAATILVALFSLSFSQDVTLTIDGTSLNYESTADIYGFQFNHNGCAQGASGGDAAANGFTISASSGVVLAFSFSGSYIPAGSGTLIDLGGDCSTLTDLVFSGPAGADALDAELSGGGDPVLPTVSIISPEDGSSFDDATSVDVEVSCSDCSDSDHYHAYLDGAMQGMFYTDIFSIPVGFGEHTLSVNLSDGGHQEYTHESASASVSFSVLEISAGGCDDPSACNDGDPDNDCTYAEENHDCDGNCTTDEDCAGICGGSTDEDECGVCEGDNSSCADCAGVPNGDAELDECGVCGGDGSSCTSPSFTELSIGYHDDGSPLINYSSNVDIYGFQFDIVSDEFDLNNVFGGDAEANGFTLSTGNGTILGFSFSGSFIPAGSGMLVAMGGIYDTCGSLCVENIIISGENGLDVDNNGNVCEDWIMDYDGDGYPDECDGDDTPPECALDCEGILDESPDDDPAGFCEWFDELGGSRGGLLG